MKTMSQFGGYEDCPFVAEFYDVVYAGERFPALMSGLDFYLNRARSAEGKVLELGCGTGRVLIPIAAADCQIVGLDLSEYMLAICREKLQRQPREVQGRVRLVQGNMADFDAGETFGLIAIPFRPFQHLVSVDEHLSCLRCANRHLEIGGKLIFDLFQVKPQRMYDPVYTKEAEDFSGIELPDGRKLRRTHRTVAFHRTEQFNDMEFAYYVTHPDGRTERLAQAFPFRYFFRYEVEHLLGRCGFRVIDLFGDFDRSPLADDSPQMIFVAEKCEERK
jgi:SAM-dependent methyltransferase